jgi:IPT/TIG domain
MRLTSLLLLILLAVGCGAGNGVSNHDPHFAFVTSPPAISSLTPSSVPVDSPSFSMTVDGHNFGTDAVLFFNGTPHQTTFVNSTRLLVVIANTDVLLAGPMRVFVRTLGLNSNTVDFDVTPQ